MKCLGRVLLFVLAVISACALARERKRVRAESSGKCGDGITWTKNGSNEYTISGTGSLTSCDTDFDGAKKITIQGVSSIAEYMFYDILSLTTVVIGDSVTSIGHYAFGGCSNLQSINIPDSVTSIESKAFQSTGLKKVEIPASVSSLSGEAFVGCEKLESFEVDENNKNYSSKNGILMNKEGTKIITFPCGKDYSENTIPDNVTAFDDYSFSVCSRWTSVTIPKTVTTIGEGAFFSCPNLQSLSLSESATSIEYLAFAFCKNLTSVSIPGSGSSIGPDAFEDCSNLKSVTLSDSITTIYNGAFTRCVSLESVKLPVDLTLISSYLFLDCINLKNVTIPNKISSIGSMAFSGCRSLKSVSIPDSVTKIDYLAFCDCESLESVKLSKNIQSIPERTFHECRNLREVKIPDGVNSIGPQAFANCSSLESVTLPKNLTSIGSSAFEGCFRIESAVFSDSVSSIGSSAFRGCTSLKNITIPASVISIGSSAFRGCASLKNITIPASVISIGVNSFSGCTNLSTIDVDPDNEEYLSENGVLFYKNKSSLIQFPCSKSCEDYDIPDGIEEVWENAFEGTVYLGEVTIPSSVISLGDKPFKMCKNLSSINVDSSNEYYRSEEGVLFDKKMETLIRFPTRKGGDYRIPDGVKEVDDDGFEGCVFLENVTLSSSVSYIGKRPFKGCSNLQSIYTVENSRYDSYDGILTSNFGEIIKFPNGRGGKYSFLDIGDGRRWIDEIGDYAFEGCSKLESLTLSESIREIGVHCFVGCKSLTSFEVSEDNHNFNSVDGVLFSNGISLEQFPPGRGGNYSVPKKTLSINEYAFEGSENLESVNIPASVKWIEAGAFEGCKSLHFVSYKGKTSPGYEPIFNGCPELKEVCVTPEYDSSHFCGFEELTTNCSIPPDSSSTASQPSLDYSVFLAPTSILLVFVVFVALFATQ